MSRIILILTISGCMICGSVSAQVKPPSPPLPPPKTYSYDNNDWAENPKGYRSIRIATFGNYQLGMTKQEYDSLIKLGELKIKTDNESYTVLLKPTFTSDRLTSLIIESKSDKEKLNDFMSMIALDYREPDSVVTNSTEKDKLKIFNSEWYWKNDLHNMTILMSRELKDGISKGSFKIMFEGNKKYFDLLKSLDKLGD